MIRCRYYAMPKMADPIVCLARCPFLEHCQLHNLPHSPLEGSPCSSVRNRDQFVVPLTMLSEVGCERRNIPFFPYLIRICKASRLQADEDIEA